MEMPELIHRRRLPHWQSDHSIYFVTWRLIDGSPELSQEERDLVQASLGFFNGARYRLIAYVVMNDHVHVMFSIIGALSLVKIIHTWKSYTANRLQREHDRSGKVWQREYFDRIIRDEREFLETINYIAGNPFKRWPELITYPWMRVPDEF